MSLSTAETIRYSRHLALPEVGRAGQEKLKAASVLVVGAGGLGCPVLWSLAAAGVGRLGVVDADTVELSNLQRQSLYATGDVGQLKTQVAKRRLLELNPEIDVEVFSERLTASNAVAILSRYQVVVDCSDNFPTRYLVNDTSLLVDIPNVYGSILGFKGQVSVFNYHAGPNYRCLFPQPPEPGTVPSCVEGGVLGVLPMVVASLQATEVLKICLDLGDVLSGRLLLYDALTMQFREWQFAKQYTQVITASDLQQWDTTVSCGVQVASRDEITVAELQQHLQARQAGEVPLHLIDVRQPFEFDLYHLYNARLLPLGQLHAAELATWDKSANYMIYCQSGQRSAKALAIMQALGFTRVRHLKGGMVAWAASQCIDAG